MEYKHEKSSKNADQRYLGYLKFKLCSQKTFLTSWAFLKNVEGLFRKKKVQLEILKSFINRIIQNQIFLIKSKISLEPLILFLFLFLILRNVYSKYFVGLRALWATFKNFTSLGLLRTFLIISDFSKILKSSQQEKSRRVYIIYLMISY